MDNPSHIKLLQYICNPLLRKFGWNIVSWGGEDDKFIKYEMRRYPEFCKIHK